MSPKDFWSLTPGEWRWLMAAAAPAGGDSMGAGELATLALQYPDEKEAAAPVANDRFGKAFGRIPSLEKVQWGWGPIAGLGRDRSPLAQSVRFDPSLSAKTEFAAQIRGLKPSLLKGGGAPAPDDDPGENQ